ncbi:hypothetical protein [Salinibacillus kushneri]|uniref:hypothetical protein n=1 Tax=Salinibacillus kushneri TaxID=237682 RepID=UPI000B83A458|nr:hypothetical protein [Salinibacillus kushneri]
MHFYIRNKRGGFDEEVLGFAITFTKGDIPGRNNIYILQIIFLIQLFSHVEMTEAFSFEM